MKKFATFVLIALSLFMFAVPAYAESQKVDYELKLCDGGYSAIQMKQEQTEWVFRINPYKGHWEMRLWSITFGYWKTDWIRM